MGNEKTLSFYLKNLDQALLAEMESAAMIQEVPANTEILRTGQFVKMIPIVLEGLVKVFTQHDYKELLLYYIQPKESCVMSFAAGLRNEPSKVFARTETDSLIALLPTDKVQDWVKKYPSFNTLFYDQYRVRYNDLIQTIHQVLFEKLDERLLQYLKERVSLTGSNPIKLTHGKIAEELGSAREVISRLLKKLESEKKVEQKEGQIWVL